jgi:hypothetical protein
MSEHALHRLRQAAQDSEVSLAAFIVMLLAEVHNA